MDVQSISIVPAPQGCQVRCKYCIAAMTKTPRGGRREMNMDKLSNSLDYARAGNAQTGILTSKASLDFEKNKELMGVEVARKVLERMVERGKAFEAIKLPWGEKGYDVFDSGLQVTPATCVVNEYKDGFKSIMEVDKNENIL